jgi:nucleoside-diphosphate-sugar epimerase
MTTGAETRRTILVTGGAGFIGSNLVEALLRRGDAVRVLDDFSTGRRENLEEADRWAREGGGRLEVIEGSICDAAAVERAVAGCSGVLHEAAIPSVPRSVKDPLTTNEVGVRGTLLLLVAARDAGVRRFVYASSSSVYGESPELPKRETMPPDPISPYGVAKLAAENYAAVFHRLYGLGTVSLRYFNVFGPRQDPASEYAAVVPRFATAILEGKPPVIYGDGEQTRDFNPVANVVEANLKALEASEQACGRAYNIACGTRISLLDLVERLARLAGRASVPIHEPTRAGDIRHSLADITAARTLLHYRATVGLDEGMKIAFEHYRAMAGKRREDVFPGQAGQ